MSQEIEPPPRENIVTPYNDRRTTVDLAVQKPEMLIQLLSGTKAALADLYERKADISKRISEKDEVLHALNLELKRRFPGSNFIYENTIYSVPGGEDAGYTWTAVVEKKITPL